MKKKLIIGLIALLSCVVFADAQNRKALRLNEVMVSNENSVVDEYGNHNGWIELFNSNYSPLEISSVFITNDKNNPTKYPVPRGDESTHMGKRQHLVFYADNQPSRGPLHLNFELVPGQDNWIGIYDADGRTLIDEIVIPASLVADQTYARNIDGEGDWQVRDGSEHLYITPMSANVINDQNDKIQMFAALDGHGFGMAAMAMCIVFSALLVLCLAFMAIDRIGSSVSRQNKAKAHGVEIQDSHSVEQDSGEVIAAICMALYQHINAHDEESAVLTINKVKRAYSPWSSKIYGLRQLPH